MLFCAAAAAAVTPSRDIDLRSPPVQGAAERIRPAAIRAHMTFLADDLLEGRGTGTRGYDVAVAYVAAQLEGIGLEPATGREWLQRVPLRRAELDLDASRVELALADGRRTPFAPGRDCLPTGGFRESSEVEAPVVFVGYGIVAPERGHDDYSAVSATGKIVAYLPGGPPAFSSDERAYYDALVKAETAAAHGAVGALRIWTPEDDAVGSGWDTVVRSLARNASFAWVEDGRPRGIEPRLTGGAWLGPSASKALFAGGRVSYEDAVSKAVPSDLPVRIRIAQRSRIPDVGSTNVVGLLRGSDPGLRAEHVVLSAHLDHLGMGPPVDGDAIYNGAVDNASGVAALIEIARAFASLPQRPRRSLLFVAFTGEEPGLIGSDYFVHRPPVPIGSIVADVNVDGISVWPFEGLVGRGVEHSTLARAAEAGAAAAGVAISPDPLPWRQPFSGSDQYSFAKAGVPSVIFGATRTPEARAVALDWVRRRYHAPSDDMSQPLDFGAAAQFARDLFYVGLAVAEDDERPAWKPGDFFGENRRPRP
jgi:Peptidase family M28